jgi:hypothetical protein
MTFRTKWQLLIHYDSSMSYISYGRMISELWITSQEVIFPNKTPCSLQVPTFLPNDGTYLKPHGVMIQNTVIPQLRELQVLFY